jgi:DDE superfamily endonuclease
MNALPLDRHDWHGDWNYTLRPEPFERIGTTRAPGVAFDTPSPHPAWLAHPAITGMTDTKGSALIARLLPLHKQLREDKLLRQRGNRPRISGEGVATGRRRTVILPDQLLATILHHRLGLQQIAIAALFGIDPGTVNRRIRDLRQLLEPPPPRRSNQRVDYRRPLYASLRAVDDARSSRAWRALSGRVR